VSHHTRYPFAQFMCDTIREEIGCVRPRDQVALDATKSIVRKRVTEMCRERGVRPSDTRKLFSMVWRKCLVMSVDEMEDVNFERYNHNHDNMDLANMRDYDSKPLCLARLFSWMRGVALRDKPLPSKAC